MAFSVVAGMATVVSVAATVAPASAAIPTRTCGEAGDQDVAVAAIPGQVKCTYYNRSANNIGGQADYFTVPSGTHTLRIEMASATGGGGGGRTTADLAVTPGQVLQINVGGRGEDGGMASDPLGHRATGGWNGGGAGGTDGFGCTINACGSGGNGAVDVRTGSYGLADRVLVAGGAGGLELVQRRGRRRRSRRGGRCQ
ncbi:MAG: Glycine rich protein [Nocardioides sp.]|nr:Glycine rich protein [Nocardioides sp.]